MSKVLVSLISEQTIPNVLFIKEKENIHEYFFISTKKMEEQGRSKWIIEACNLKNHPIKIIEVDQNSVIDIMEKLKIEDFSDENQYYINITGGTKLMSLATYQFFKEFDSKIFYISGFKNEYTQVFPKKSSIFKFKHELTLLEYLISIGFRANGIKEMNTVHDFQIIEKIFNDYTNDTINYKLINYLRLQYRNTGIKSISSFEHDYFTKELLLEFIDRYAINLNGDSIHRSEIEFITGGWFEEYTYYLVKKKLNLEDSQIGINLKRAGIIPNEFDIMYVINNELHIIECKTSIFHIDIDGKKKSLFGEIVYKNDALRKEFGLFAKSYLFTLSDLTDNNTNEIKKELKERANFHKVEIIDKIKILNSDF